MKIHTQNLNEKNGNIIGSMLWNGRAWLRKSKGYDELCHIQWLFGKFARNWGLTATFGYGDSDSGLCLHACVPFIFSFYITFPHVYRCKESEVGVATHNGAIWLYTFTGRNDSSSDDPWWKKTHSWYFPWTLNHHLTEILEHRANLPGLAKAIWSDSGKKFLESYEDRKSAEASVSETYDYTYVLKNGTVQHRKATVHVDRMTWRARWWPLIPIQKVRTSIWMDFDGEVGEKTGSWKGGCTGCGCEMLPGETPMQTLRRMEKERKF